MLYVFIFIVALALLIRLCSRRSLVGVYVGSFDPPHAGHREVIDAALVAGCERVLVLPNVPHNSKLYRMGLRYRVEMCRAFFTHPCITVTPQPADDVLALLHKQQRVCALIGSDAALKLLQSGKAHYSQHVDAWLVMQRPGETWPKVTHLCGKPIMEVVRSRFPTHQSSTAVRAALIRGEPVETIAFITKQNLYWALNTAAVLTGRFAEGVCDIPSPQGGSEHSVTFTYNDDTIVKVYRNTANAKEFANWQLLKLCGLPCVEMHCVGGYLSGPGILIIPNLHRRGFVCVETLLKAAPLGDRVAIKALHSVAQSLHNLHTSKVAQACYESVVVHGDATSRNVFFHPLTNEVLWIDFLKAKEDGDPLREMYQFISGLHYYKVPNAHIWGEMFEGAYDAQCSAEEREAARKQWPLLNQ